MLKNLRLCFSLIIILLTFQITISQISPVIRDSTGSLVSRSTVSALSSATISLWASPHTGAYDPITRTTLDAFENYSLNVGCNPRELDIDGNVLYVVCTDRLIWVDITDLDSMYILDSIVVGEQLSDIEVRGNFAYVIQQADQGNLLLFDIHAPETLRLIDTIYHSDTLQFRMIDLEGNVAYIACKNGVMSLNITYPDSPVFLDYLKLGNYVFNKDIIIDGDWGYISGERYIFIIDIEHPDSIRKIGQVLNYRSWSIAIDGDYLFSAVYYYGFRIYDIRDSIPVLLEEVELPENLHPCAITVLGDWLYIGSIIYDTYGTFGSISVYSIKHPDSAIWADGASFLGCPFFEFDNNGQTWILSVSGMGDTLGKIKALCVGVLDTMFTYNFIDLIEPDAPPSQVIVKGNTAAIVDSIGLRFIDISEPDDPVDYCRFYRFWRKGAIFYGIDWVGNYIYLTSSARLHPDSGGLWVVDAQYPESLCIPRWWSHTSPKETVYVGNLDGELLSCFMYGHYGSIGEVKVDGNIAYVFGYDDTIASDSLRYILDSYNVTNSDSLTPISSYSKKTAKNDGTPILPSSYNSRMGVVKVVGDTIYASERMVPYEPFHTLAPFGVHNHIFLFSVTNPESVKGMVSVRDTFNMGYVSDGDDIAGDIEPCGNVLYSLFSTHHYEGLPIYNLYVEYGGLYMLSYNIKRTVGPSRWYGRNSAAIYVDTLWRYPSSVGFYAWPDSNSHALDLLIDGDYAFASAGYLNFGPKEGLWCINIKHPDSINSFNINKFEFDTTLDSCLA